MSQHIKEIALLVSALDPESGGTFAGGRAGKVPPGLRPKCPQVGAILPAPAKMPDPEGGGILPARA